MKNGYSQKMRQEKQAYLQIGVDAGIQMMADFISLSLNSPKIMGKDVMGAMRLSKALDGANEFHRLFLKAFGTGPEADYYRAKLDERLEQIYGDAAVPFEERYPFLKQIRYR